MKNLKMPIGIDDFAKIRTNGFYYIDKTGMLKELLSNWGEVNLFTRPRRFGKSINMSMLQYFFEIGTDESLFDGLAISTDKELCDEYLGKFPVISISLKQVSGKSYDIAEANVRNIIATEAGRFSFLLESTKLDNEDKKNLMGLRSGNCLIDSSIYHLSRLLCKHYGKKVIILIDEYDAPIQKAYENGYYDEMVLLMRQIFGYALKSNKALFFSVLTGCMRISKESLFSDLNNPKMYTLVDESCDEWFGFTDSEVRKLLDDYNLGQYYETTRDWYDGYRIGATDIYCPWDVINWCNQLLTTSDKTPGNYWTNVGENSIIYRLASMSEDADKYELEVLSEGGYVDKMLLFDQTYKDIESSVDNIWTILFTTGYLTQRGCNEDGTYRLAIPNREVRHVFAGQIEKWFVEKMENGLQDMYRAFDEGNAGNIEQTINACLKESISFMDGGNTEEQKEASYHMLLIGMLKGRRGWIVKSNREAGKGRADIILINRIKKEGIIIEVKHTNDSEQLEAETRKACKQIKDMDYKDFFRGFSIDSIKEYGIAFCGKECKVLKG